MKYRYLIIALLLLIAGFPAKAADDFQLKIEFKAPQLKEKTIKLINYFNGSNFIQDSAKISKKGEGVIFKKDPLPEGLYIIYIDSTKYFDILLGDDQTFKLSIDTTNFVRNNIIEGSEQTEAFFEYARFISTRHGEQMSLFNERKELMNEGKDFEKITEKMDSLNKVVMSFQEDFFKKHENQWVGKFFKGITPVETGPFPSPQTMEEAREEFYYQKYHFFDNIDMKDRRYWYTNYFPPKIDEYMKRYVEFIPDSAANASSWLVAQTMSSTDSISFRLMLRKLMNNAIESDLMGMENTWAKLAEDYYFKGYVSSPDSTFLANLKSEYKKIMYNRIGMKAHDLALLDTVGNKVNLYDIAGKYTLVYFYEPSCGHCRKTTPLVHNELYAKYKDKGFRVACICTVADPGECLKFIRENGLTDWDNLSDPNRESYFWQFYDTSVTPSIYLIDSEKKIIAKKLDVESLDRFLGSIFGMSPSPQGNLQTEKQSTEIQPDTSPAN